MISYQFMIYVGIGALSAIVDVAMMTALIMLGVHYGVAASLGFVAGLMFNYTCQSKVTFRATSSLSTITKFGVVTFMNYLITLACIIASMHWLSSVLIGKLASLTAVAANGFLWSKYWIFK